MFLFHIDFRKRLAVHFFEVGFIFSRADDRGRKTRKARERRKSFQLIYSSQSPGEVISGRSRVPNINGVASLEDATGQAYARVKHAMDTCNALDKRLQQRRRKAKRMELRSSSGSEDAWKRASWRMRLIRSSFWRPTVPYAEAMSAQRRLAARSRHV